MLVVGSANKERGEDELQVKEEPAFIWSRLVIRKFRLDAVVIKENGNKKGVKWGLFDEGLEETMILQRSNVRESLSLHSPSITWNAERSLLDKYLCNGRRHGVRGHLFLTFSVFPHGI
jgi:hypothetical protein